MSRSSTSSRPDARPAKGWPPRWLTKTTPAERKRGDGAQYVNFIEATCRITKESFAGGSGQLLVFRPWQRQLFEALLARRADGHRKHRQALIGIARKNTKSTMSSGLGLGGLVLEADGAEVYSCAADRDQARIVFGTAKRMVELDPELSSIIKVYRDVLEVPSTGSIYRVLSAEAFTKEGLSPTLVLFDEVHAQPNRELWDVMNLGSGARIDPLVLGITTAGARSDNLGRDSLCYGLYEHGKRVARGELEDTSFFFCWWEPVLGAEADHRSPKVWKEANPGYGDLIDPEDFAAVLPRTPESEFRTKRTNVFVVSKDSALPHGAWDQLADPDRKAAPGADIMVFLDGSYSGDSTGLVGCTIEARPHLFVIDVWENPDDDAWRVNIADVEARVLEACRSWRVVEAPCDPFRWQKSMESLAAEGVPIVEYPTSSVPRIVPAWQKFYDGVLDATFTHDGDPRLARHVENMVLKIDARGVRPVKEHRNSRRHIDLGICAVGAFDRATAAREIEPVMALPEAILL